MNRLHRLVAGCQVCEVTNSELLRQFLQQRKEMAFADLMERQEAMVPGRLLPRAA